MTESSGHHRWSWLFAALIIFVLSALTGAVFHHEPAVNTLFVDLRGIYDQNSVDQQLNAHADFQGKVIFVLPAGSAPPCQKTAAQKRRLGREDADEIAVYCPLPGSHHMTLFPPRDSDIADIASAFSVVVQSTTGRLSFAGPAQSGFGWVPALVTGTLLTALAIGLAVVTRSNRPVPVLAATAPETPQASTWTVVGQPGHDAPADQPTRPEPPRTTAPPRARWAPPTPSAVVLGTAGSSVLPELAELVGIVGNQAVVRTDIEARGGYVALGDVIAWATGPAGAVPGDAVRVELTGDSLAPLTISPVPSHLMQEQGYRP